MSPSRQIPRTACLGYDENGKGFACPNKPGTPWTPLWCPECDERRRNRITRQLRDIQQMFGDSQ